LSARTILDHFEYFNAPTISNRREYDDMRVGV